MLRQNTIVNGTPLAGEEYLSDNTVFWKVIHKLTKGGPAWEKTSIFYLNHDIRGAWKS